MKYAPVLEQFEPNPTSAMMIKALQLAERILREQPELAISDVFRPFRCDALNGGSALHLDELSGVMRLGATADLAYHQDRARLRAGDGDWLVTLSPEVEGYAAYCTDRLGLGEPTWLRPSAEFGWLHLAESTWCDRSVRRTLVQAMRHEGLCYLHPHMGVKSIWELALLLASTSRRPLQVIAPPPELTQWVNSKAAFNQVVTALFDDCTVPPSAAAWSEAILVQKLRELAASCRQIGVKLPNSAGGGGNVVFDAREFRGKSLVQIRGLIQRRLPTQWNTSWPVRVDCWESDLICSPSVQTWIPPEFDKPPVVEGVFVQAIQGPEGAFEGVHPAELPHAIIAEMVERSWLLALLFQRLGYVGRCSFDLILLATSLGQARCEFIECNGRWGGASLPMTLMNRLFGDWKSRPYCVRSVVIPGLRSLGFPTLLQTLDAELYDHRSGQGSLILFEPGSLRTHDALSFITFAQTQAAAERQAFEEIPARLRQLASA